MVAHLVWDQGVAGSNPVIPTNFNFVYMSKYEKIMYYTLYTLNALALGLSVINHEYVKAIWIFNATLWMYTAHRYRRAQ